MTRQVHVRLITSLVIVLGWAASFFQAQGQPLPADISFERITIPGTIRSSQVTNIVQDNAGLIWLTGDGLYRYDGFRFRQYRELADGREIVNPQDFLSLLNDSSGNRILLGTRRSGIVTYDRATDKLIALPSIGNTPIVNQLLQAGDGKIWAASYNSGLFYLENDTLRKLADPRRQYLHPASLAHAGSKLYIGEISKVLIMEGEQVTDRIELSWQGKQLPAYVQVTSLHIDRSGKLWVGTEKQGVLVYDLTKKEFIKYFPPSRAPFFSRISRIHQDRQGLIWILTKASGLVVYSPEKDEMTHLVKDPFSTKSISSDNCFSICEDRQGIVWIGATGDINKYDHQQIKFQHIYHNPLGKLSLTDNMVRGICEDREGKIWVGTDGGYINVLDLEKETVEQFKVSPGNDSSNYVPLYFAELDRRYMLVGTTQGPLQYDREKRSFDLLKTLSQQTGRRVFRQMIRHGDNLYFIYNGIVHLHNFRTGKTERHSNAGDEEAINLTAIYVDREGRLWVGSNAGVSLYDSVKKKFRLIRLRQTPAASDGLLLVLSIQQVDDKLYVGTFNAGLWEIDIADVKNIPDPKNYADRNGLPSNTVYAALPDDDGYLWLSTNNGLARFDPRTGKFISFSISEGVQEEEFNRLAYTKTKNGKLIFGGINGINVFDPNTVTVEQEEYTPEILSVTASNPLAKQPVSTQFIPSGKKLTLDFEQNFVNIQFFVPHYRIPKRYTLFFKLENFEKEWREVTGENTATYANLQPGTYTFCLKTVAVDGVERVAKLPLTIEPPYWKAWWFILLTVCVVAFLIMTILRSYMKRAQNDRRRLEHLLKIRTSEIEKSKEELQVLNQKKDLIFSILSHDLRSPLTTLKGFLGYIIDHAEELTKDDLKKHAVNIRNSVTNSLDLIDNTLFWSLSQMGTIQYTPTTFSLTHLLEKLKGLYQLTADKKRIPLTISCEEELMLHGDENMIYVTLRNLVSNALKFTTEGNPVFISCSSREGSIEIKVVDRGIGMSQDYLRRILSMDQPMLKKGTSNEKGTGLGLLLCKKFVELHNGELQITSIENIGTTFTVILPLTMQESLAETPPKV